MVTARELTSPGNFEDEAFLDFLSGLRAFTLTKVFSSMSAAAAVAQDAYEAAHGQALTELDAARRIFDPLPIVAERNRLMRSIQDLQWARVAATFEPRRTEIEAALAEAASRGPGSLTLDPELDLPPIYAGVPFHLQPGGYSTDPLAGLIYHEGLRVFYGGRSDGSARNDDEVKVETVSSLPGPADGVVERVLDLACSAGQSTTALKTLHPEAEVWGIDIAAPMLTYAHYRAVHGDKDVHFAQQAAQRLAFSDGSFDFVYCNILFHEVPVEVAREVVSSVRRVLRKGGVFAVNDFTPMPDPASGFRRYLRDFDSRFNGEPFGYAFVHSDLTGLLASTFDSVEIVAQNPQTTTWICRR